MSKTNLLEAMCERARLQSVFYDLEERVRDGRVWQSSAAKNSPLTLQWILFNQHKVAVEIRRSISRQHYQPEQAKRIFLKTDKERILYVFDWPDRIVQMCLAQVLSALGERSFVPQLFSFRKTFNNHQAIKSLACCISKHSSNGTGIYVSHRDVKSYGENICFDFLKNKIEALAGPQEEYFWKIFQQMLQPRFFDPSKGESGVIEKGVASGSPLVPVCENIYLANLDLEITQQHSDLFYARFGDDIALAHVSPEPLRAGVTQLESHLTSLELELNTEKAVDCLLSETGSETEGFQWKPSINYLGTQIAWNGGLFLPPKKLRRFQNTVRKTARRSYVANKKEGRSSAERIDAMISSLNKLFEETELLPYLDVLMGLGVNQSKLKKLDSWIAKQVLRCQFGSGHDRVFRHVSYKDLRNRGLRSLANLRHRRMRGQ